MDGMNVFYRAFLEYKKHTATDKNIKKLADALLSAPTDEDKLEAVLLQCKIEEDWVKIIEVGLEHVEKAIHEERQFIRKEGEVVPIEKLKRVSTETVRHLAKHSNLITREPEEGEDVSPEKLYMAENLSDYAVYENRFLYMLLCYVRDFINVRLDRILESGKTCKITMDADKHTRVGKQFLKYHVSFYYEDKNDPLANTEQNDLIKRIETAQRLTAALLMTPLMREVSKAPMISPPITRTNVLRMNVHFSAALEMYGQLSAYTKQGYELIEKKNISRPFGSACHEEITQTVLLQAFLAYKHGNKQEDILKEIYEQEEREAFERHKQELAVKLIEARQRLEAKQITAEEYILLQEERIKHLEESEQALKKAESKIERLNEKVLAQESEINALNENVADLKHTIAEKNELLRKKEWDFKEEKLAMQAEHKAEIRKYESEREEVRKKFEAEAQERIKVAEAAAQERINATETAAQERINAAEAEKEGFRVLANYEKEEYLKMAREAREAMKKSEDARKVAQAQLHGLRALYNLIPAEELYTSKEQFMELEEEFDAFQAFLKKQWKQTKKRIREDILWKKPEETPTEFLEGAKAEELLDEQAAQEEQSKKKSLFDKLKGSGTGKHREKKLTPEEELLNRAINEEAEDAEESETQEENNNQETVEKRDDNENA